jgi:group I intron endonuclease
MITYTATNTRTGQFYIGSTTNFQKRQKEHLSSKDPYPFQRALSKSPEDFIWEWSEDDLDEPLFEQALLDLFFGTKFCYNLSSDATAPMRGQTHSPETKAKIGAKHRGKKVSEETREKIRQARLGKSHLKGRKFPGRSAGKENAASKKVKVTFPCGDEKIFDFGREAADYLGCSYSTLHKWCRTEKTPKWGKFLGFSFRYV